MSENGWFSWKWVKFALFAPQGGSKPIEFACFFVGLGAGARKSSRKPLFSWKSTNFINFYGIPLKWVDFHEKCGFLSFWWHLLQTIQKRCIFYRFWAPPGSKKWEFHPFSWNSPHFGNFHKNHPKLWNYHKFRISGSRGALKGIGIHWHYVCFSKGRQKSREITNFHEIHIHFMKIH